MIFPSSALVFPLWLKTILSVDQPVDCHDDMSFRRMQLDVSVLSSDASFKSARWTPGEARGSL